MKCLVKEFKKLGYRVICANHPCRSDFSDLDLIGFDEFSTGNTSKMIEKSDVILTHFSTAINFAILNEKPIVFYSPIDQIKPYIDVMNGELCCVAIDYGEESNLKELPYQTFDMEKYKSYITKWII